MPLFRDDAMFEQTLAALESFIDPEIESRAPWQGTDASAYVGVDGFRQLWLDWLEPWVEYRTHVDDLVAAGNRVVVLIRDRARRHDSDAEVELRAGSIWELREGRVCRVEFYARQEEALEAAGLS